MSRPTVAIVGLGQIGGSFAAALTKRRLARVVGITRRAETAARARRMGILAEAGTDLAAVSEADVVVLATPVRTLIRQIPEVVPLMRPRKLLTDVGSTKTEIMQAFRRARPKSPVLGGHPMAGNERAGLDGVDPNLFESRPWVLVSSIHDIPGTSPAFSGFGKLVEAVGAKPLWIREKDHDLKVARVSHIPYLLSYALMGTPEESVRVCGNSFRDATRVAKSDPDMVLDFLLTNRGPIRRSARELTKHLERLLRMVDRGDAAGLRKALSRARERRGRI
jgi:prephenate dehydrogenase